MYFVEFLEALSRVAENLSCVPLEIEQQYKE